MCVWMQVLDLVQIKENRCFSKRISVCWTESKLSARAQKPREAEIKVKSKIAVFILFYFYFISLGQYPQE